MRNLIIATTTTILLILFVLPVLMLIPIKMIPSGDQPGYDWVNNISIYGERNFRQEFVSTEKNMMAIGTSIRNPNLKNKKEIIFNLYDENNKLLRTVVLNGFNIGDGNFEKIVFEPITDSKNKKYFLEISSSTAGEEDIIKLFITKPTSVVKNYTYDKETYEGGIPMVTFHKPESIFKYKNYFSKFVIKMVNELTQRSKFILYTSPKGDVKLDIYVQDETLWLTQKMMAELFNVEVHTINYHLKEIYKNGELLVDPTIRKIRIVQNEGGREVSRDVDFYSLDAIIAVGYRVNSQRATQFRIWATQIPREYIIKGFVLNDDRLKQGQRVFDQDYFKELLERVRSIRASERRIYQQITDIFAECSIDYNPHSKTTKDFFATIQNKFHFAITGHTAAELIQERSDYKKAYMGLTTWKNSPDGRILPSDVVIAKNYLPEKQIKRLERTISGFFDYIENLIENQQVFNMEEFIESVNNFLTFNKYNILTGKGKISKDDVDKKALEEYKEFNKTQPIESDFDKVVKKLFKGGKDV